MRYGKELPLKAIRAVRAEAPAMLASVSQLMPQ
jgi:hypothetical protein